jgi:hypothetical protein
MADAPPPPPELRTVKLSTVIHRAVERTYKELIAVAQKYLAASLWNYHPIYSILF